MSIGLHIVTINAAGNEILAAKIYAIGRQGERSMSICKYYNSYIPTREEADVFSRFLKENGFYYERSACGEGFHFEVKLATYEVQKVNDFLDTLP